MNITQQLANALRTLYVLELAGSIDPTKQAIKKQVLAALAEYDTHETRDLWIMEAPVLTTEHILQRTAEFLAEATMDENLNIHHLNGGWLVFVGEDEENISDDFPEELQSLMRWCMARKFIWLRLDQDGDTLPGYSLYDW